MSKKVIINIILVALLLTTAAIGLSVNSFALGSTPPSQEKMVNTKKESKVTASYVTLRGKKVNLTGISSSAVKSIKKYAAVYDKIKKADYAVCSEDIENEITLGSTILKSIKVNDASKQIVAMQDDLVKYLELVLEYERYQQADSYMEALASAPSIRECAEIVKEGKLSKVNSFTRKLVELMGNRELD